MNIASKKWTRFFLVIFVSLMIVLFSLHELILVQQPTLMVHDGHSKISSASNFTSISSLDPVLLPSETSITYLNESNQPASFFSLNLNHVRAFYDTGGRAIQLAFYVTILGNISSNIHITGIQLQLTAQNNGTANKTQIYWLNFVSSTAMSNLSLENTVYNANLTSFTVPFKVLNHPSESFFGGYSVERYTFSYVVNNDTGQDISSFEFTPSIGVHAFNLSLSLEGTNEPISTSIGIILTNK